MQVGKVLLLAPRRFSRALPLRADRSPAYAPDGSADPALDEAHDVVD